MTERERLIRLLDDGCFEACKKKNDDIKLVHYLADYLLENGVTIKPWISVEDKLPTTDGCFEVTIKGAKGKRYVTVCNFSVHARLCKWENDKRVIAWREHDEPYRN